MFNLKRTRDASKQQSKRIRSSGFGGSDSSEEEADQEQLFRQSIEDKSKKIAKEASKGDENDEIGYIARGIAGEEAAEVRSEKKQDTEGGSKYLKGIKEAVQQRKQEQLAHRQRLMEKKAQKSGATVFESEEFAKRKHSTLGGGDSELHGEEETDVGLTAMITEGMRPVTEKSEIVEPSVSRKTNIRSGNTQADRVEGEERNGPVVDKKSTSLLDKLREMIKSKVTREYLEDQKKQYFVRKGIHTEV